MFVRNSLVLVACAALGLVACENKTDTRTEPNPGATTTPPAEKPVTITNAPVAPKEPAVAPVPVNPIANASNASEVTQFPEQQKVAPSQAKIVTVAATVRPAPQSSDQVQVVKQGLEVTEVASDKDYFLVLFNDPTDTTKQKAGWVHKDAVQNYAFERQDKTANEAKAGPSAAKTAPAAAKLTCNAGEVRLQTDKEFCAHQCKEDSDCKKLNGVCDGSGKMVSLSGQLTPAHYCVTSSAPGATQTGTSTGTPNTASPSNAAKPSTPSQAKPSTPAP